MTYASGLPLRTQESLADGVEPLGRLAERYRVLRNRVSDMLGRGDRDYSTLTALSQEISWIRQKIRQELERRRRSRKERRNRHTATWNRRLQD
jgi:hypothetical protein